LAFQLALKGGADATAAIHWHLAASQKSCTVKYSRLKYVEVEVIQALQIDDHCVFAISRTPGMSMNSALLAEIVIREIFAAVLGQVLATLDQIELPIRDFLQNCTPADTK
jgi:hypothetical protein